MTDRGKSTILKPLSKVTGLAACNRTPRSMFTTNYRSGSNSGSTPPISGLEDRTPKVSPLVLNAGGATVTKRKIQPINSAMMVSNADDVDGFRPASSQSNSSGSYAATPPSSSKPCCETISNTYEYDNVYDIRPNGGGDCVATGPSARNGAIALRVKLDVGVDYHRHNHQHGNRSSTRDPPISGLRRSVSNDSLEVLNNYVRHDTPSPALHSDDQPQTSAIKVAVRVRPFLPRELVGSDSARRCVEVVDKNSLKITSLRPSSSTFATSSQSRETEFSFDHCFDSFDVSSRHYAGQDLIYQEIGRPLLDHALEGYNVCLFAYGQTGSGKSYTISGTQDRPGIVSRFGTDLFQTISAHESSSTSTSSHGNSSATRTKISISARISYYEIYNEEVHDLLSAENFRKALKVREHPKFGPFVENISTHPLESYEEMQRYIEEAERRRATAHTDANESSSRSHAVVTIVINKSFIDTDSSLAERIQTANVNFVDLAGSEKVSFDADPDRMKEGKHINTSLLTLRKVLSQLADRSNSSSSGSSRNGHVAYRESILTWLLKESLGGNSRTTMIATVSPAQAHSEESLSTLRYAATARRVINSGIRVNEDFNRNNRHFADENSPLIKDLKLQVEILKSELERQYTNQLVSRTPWFKAALEGRTPDESGCRTSHDGESPLLKELIRDMDEHRSFLNRYEPLCDEKRKSIAADHHTAFIKRLNDLFSDVLKEDAVSKPKCEKTSPKRIDDDWGSSGNGWGNEKKDSPKNVTTSPKASSSNGWNSGSPSGTTASGNNRSSSPKTVTANSDSWGATSNGWNDSSKKASPPKNEKKNSSNNEDDWGSSEASAPVASANETPTSAGWGATSTSDDWGSANDTSAPTPVVSTTAATDDWGNEDGAEESSKSNSKHNKKHKKDKDKKKEKKDKEREKDNSKNGTLMNGSNNKKVTFEEPSKSDKGPDDWTSSTSNGWNPNPKESSTSKSNDDDWGSAPAASSSNKNGTNEDQSEDWGADDNGRSDGGNNEGNSKSDGGDDWGSGGWGNESQATSSEKKEESNNASNSGWGDAGW